MGRMGSMAAKFSSIRRADSDRNGRLLDGSHGGADERPAAFDVLPDGKHASSSRRAGDLQDVADNHVLPFGKDVHFRESEAGEWLSLPVVCPGGSIQRLAGSGDAGEDRSKMVVEFFPILALDGVPHQPFILLSPGGVGPGRMLRRAGTTKECKSKNRSHQPHGAILTAAAVAFLMLSAGRAAGGSAPALGSRFRMAETEKPPNQGGSSEKTDLPYLEFPDPVSP